MGHRFLVITALAVIVSVAVPAHALAAEGPPPELKWWDVITTCKGSTFYVWGRIRTNPQDPELSNGIVVSLEGDLQAATQTVGDKWEITFPPVPKGTNFTAIMWWPEGYQRPKDPGVLRISVVISGDMYASCTTGVGSSPSAGAVAAPTTATDLAAGSTSTTVKVWNIVRVGLLPKVTTLFGEFPTTPGKLQIPLPPVGKYYFVELGPKGTYVWVPEKWKPGEGIPTLQCTDAGCTFSGVPAYQSRSNDWWGSWRASQWNARR